MEDGAGEEARDQIMLQGVTCEAACCWKEPEPGLR